MSETSRTSSPTSRSTRSSTTSTDEVREETRETSRANLRRLPEGDRAHPAAARREEESALARRVRAGDEAAKARLIEANLRLVVQIARRYRNRGLAAARPDRGGQPRPAARGREVRRPSAARASRRTRRGGSARPIVRALANQARTIRLPVHVELLLGRYKREQQRLTQDARASADDGGAGGRPSARPWSRWRSWRRSASSRCRSRRRSAPSGGG